MTSVTTNRNNGADERIKKHYEIMNIELLLLLLALGGCSWPSLLHEVTHDFLVVHIKASQKSLGDKPKSVHIFLQTPREVYTRKS